MKALLLDGHVFLWWLSDAAELGPQTREAIADPSSEVYVSSATIWELEIKAAAGKLRVPSGMLEALYEGGFLELEVSARHARRAAWLEWDHRDPFDRMLVAQAQIEGLSLVTADTSVRQFDSGCLDARS
ncbi:MAG: type II toxin-antitoxin system VapC family toxin [Actinomycetota bacterium]